MLPFLEIGGVMCRLNEVNMTTAILDNIVLWFVCFLASFQNRNVQGAQPKTELQRVTRNAPPNYK